MRLSKRLFDILAAGLGLLLLWPIFGLLALLIWLDDRGPIVFSQERIGRGGRPFRMHKFRTMTVRADHGLPLTVGSDHRITRVGQWLRRFKLDELPQLVHVLRGEMSLVGPRPEVRRYVELYSTEQRRVLELVPGITDPASLRYWDEGDLLARAADPERFYVSQVMPEKIQLQLEYARQSSEWTDFLVTLATLRRLWPLTRPLLMRGLVRYRRPVILAVHVLLVALGFGLAVALRFDFRAPPAIWRTFWHALPVLLVCRLVTYGRFGLYRGFWQHVGLRDLVSLFKAAAVGSLIFFAICRGLRVAPDLSYAILLNEWAAAVLLTGGVRFTARYLREAQLPFERALGRRTLVIGAGDKAERLVREVVRDVNHPLNVVGLVAEASSGGRTIHGVPVLGTVDTLGALVTEHQIEFVVVAVDRVDGELVQKVLTEAQRVGVEVKTLPSLQELLAGTARIDQLRSVRLEDLLSREPVNLDLRAVEAEVRHRVVVVTGGAGSIGSELARQLAAFEPSRLVLLDQAESPLYFTQLELAAAHPRLDFRGIICDVSDAERVDRLFEELRPDYVIHAAAYKHVPLAETNVVATARNNIGGTLAVATAAAAWGAAKFVLISTDKAVNPTSIMGATKRVAERLVLELPALRTARTDVRVVRFGNVLGSSGSVIPLFERQLAQGGPLTVTHPEVERYFMTVREAVQLVLLAATLPEASRRVCMLDMGRPVRIVALAEQLIRLAELEPYRDIPIVFTGLRPGEKLHEELCSPGQTPVPTSVPKIGVLRSAETDGADLLTGLAVLETALASADELATLRALTALVPECVDFLGLGRRSPAPFELVRDGSARRAARAAGAMPLVTDPASSLLTPEAL
jgi:FlaA1/EpsC-like NDP-sugar epimerase/lipopolysaccharide/colanic/teichoic acid biosynthesis glycosyltransferase